MRATEVSPERMRRIRTLCIVMFGVCIPLVGSAAYSGLLLLMDGRRAQGWLYYAPIVAELVLTALTMIVCYRCARFSRLPGIPAILALVATLWAVVLLNHYA